MDLQNTLAHKRNTAVNVDGTEYKIDEHGVCRGVTDEHAKTMLQNNAWRPFMQRKPVEGSEAPKADRPRLQPILSNGQVLTPAADPRPEALKTTLGGPLPTQSLEPSAPVESEEDAAEEEKKPAAKPSKAKKHK